MFDDSLRRPTVPAPGFAPGGIEPAGGAALKASILRARQGGEAVLTLESALDWELYAGPHPEKIDYAAPLLGGRASGRFKLPVNPAERAYFVLRTELGDITLAEQRLPLAGSYNCRDLGGFRAAGGKSVAWGRVFRADGLEALTADDLAYLKSIRLATIVDFRTDNERRLAPDRLPAGLKKVLHCPVFPGSLSHEDFENARTAEESRRVMRRMYSLFVTDEPTVERFRALFRSLQEAEGPPLLFHCAAGKDRTGVAAALFLISLGVEREAVMCDYLASAHYLEGKYPEGDDLFSVKPEFLEAALESVEERAGSVESYLTTALDVDLSRMRELYLI